MLGLLSLLNSDTFQKLSAALAALASVVLTLVPEHTIAYKIALALIPLTAGHGVLSAGHSDAPKGSSEDPFSGG